MNNDERQVREHHFIEQWALLFSEVGGSPMMGRVLGHLLVCDPPMQSSAELAEALDASKGSISTTTRQLVAAGMIEKVSVRGSRATHFRLRDNAMEHHIHGDIARLGIMVALIDEGLDLYGDDEGRTDRLRAFREFYAFLRREMPALLERWKTERGTT